ncbi:oxidoreductase [Clostridia bacterium]|nr:oxidoreductase [Clostridia bacterium]
MSKKLNIALVGLGFGGAFVEIYKAHPDVESIALFDTDSNVLKRTSDYSGITKIYGSFDEVLNDKDLDAVHIVTPLLLHEDQTVQVLESGKHCACTIPMAASLNGIKRITEAKRKSGKNYMMMETTLYTYQFFYVKELIANGKIGKIQFLRGSHYQDMANWPDYWLGLPPMYNGTHAIAPMTVLSGSRIKRVNCFGSGTMAESLTKKYNNPFPVESALLEYENGLKGEVTRSLFETAREYQEGLFVYGSEGCFEWGFRDADLPYYTAAIPPVEGRRGGGAHTEIVEMPNYCGSLPKEIQRFTVGGNYDPLNPQESLKKGAGAGHHGSHAHLVHEFVSSIIENRKPWIDEVLAGNITGAGICAHESAMNNGEAVIVPVF